MPGRPEVGRLPESSARGAGDGRRPSAAAQGRALPHQWNSSRGRKPRDRVVDAYAHVGINAQGSIRLDLGAAAPRRAWLVTARRLSVTGADHGWTYALEKLAPVKTDVGRGSDLARVDRRVRLAAWRTAHGVRPAWRAHRGDAAATTGPSSNPTRAERRTLPMAGPGAATLLDEAIDRAAEAERAGLEDRTLSLGRATTYDDVTFNPTDDAR